jgi:peptidoglycan/LPS O-acetylase OafA/YrhL
VNDTFETFVAQLFFAFNWFYWQTQSFNGPIWSISTEILVYIAFFYTMRFFGGSLFVAMGALSIAMLLLHKHLNFIFDPHVLECAIYFFAGGIVQRLSKYRLTLPLAVLISVSIGTAAASSFIDLRFSILVALSACLVLILAQLGESLLQPICRPLAFLGNATYSSYLLHFPIQLALVCIIDAMGLSRAIFYQPSVFVCYLILVVGLSLVVYHRFELPAQIALRGSWRRRVVPAA